MSLAFLILAIFFMLVAAFGVAMPFKANPVYLSLACYFLSLVPWRR